MILNSFIKVNVHLEQCFQFSTFDFVNTHRTLTTYKVYISGKLNMKQIRTQLFQWGGGVHFKLERTSCQQSLKYVSIVRKVHLFLLRKKISFCVCKILNNYSTSSSRT